MILLFLLVLPLSAFDVLRDHLENLIDHSVNPCDDFYSHVCKSGTPGDRFISSKLSSSFNGMSSSLQANTSEDNQLLLDIYKMFEGNSSSIKNMNYAQLAKQRCGNELDCYLADRQYYMEKFGKILNMFIDQEGEEEEDSVDDLQTKIEKTIAETTKFINDTLPTFFKKLVNGRIRVEIQEDPAIYSLILSRIQMIKFLKTNSTFNDLHDIKAYTNQMKESMLEKINSTTWLHQDEISRAILAVILKKVSSIEVYQDYDHLDQNLTTLHVLEREFHMLYYSIGERRTGVEELDICFRLMDVYQQMYSNFTDEMKVYFRRVGKDFMANAFYSRENTITVLAPFLFKKLVSSDLVSEPLLTYAVIGHELFHSMFTRSASTLIDVYGKKGVCLKEHYGRTCSLYGKGTCRSSDYRIFEDGADAEGVRLLYDMFAEQHTTDLDNEIVVHGTTLLKAFFYFTSILHCKESGPAHSLRDSHSSGTVRVNAVVSLMPEFSRAFGCKRDDNMFAEERKCQVFGKNA